MYVHCKHTDCFWHSNIEPSQCTRGLIIIGEECKCIFYKPPKKKDNETQDNLSSSLIDEDGFPIT